MTEKFVDFSDDPIPVSKLLMYINAPPAKRMVVPLNWVGTSFKAPRFCPQTYEMVDKITNEWLAENCQGESMIVTDSSKYYSATGIDDCVWYVYFENRNDALMFKLQGGHQAWKNR